MGDINIKHISQLALGDIFNINLAAETDEAYNRETPEDGTAAQQYAEDADFEEVLPYEEACADYPDDCDLFRTEIRVPELTQMLSQLVRQRQQQGKVINRTHWYVVWKTFYTYHFITDKNTHKKFIQWVDDNFGWTGKVRDFRHISPEGVADIPLDKWSDENPPSSQAPQAKDYTVWRDALKEAFICVDYNGNLNCRKEFRTNWFDTSLEL